VLVRLELDDRISGMPGRPGRHTQVQRLNRKNLADALSPHTDIARIGHIPGAVGDCHNRGCRGPGDLLTYWRVGLAIPAAVSVKAHRGDRKS
jgi:hypothetical protein